MDKFTKLLDTLSEIGYLERENYEIKRIDATCWNRRGDYSPSTRYRSR